MTFDRQVALTSCLLLYQNRQDNALGMEHITARQKGLLWYYRTLQTDITTKALTAGYLNGIIQEAAAEIKTLVKRAEKAKDKHKIARRVVTLEKIADEAREELDALEKAEKPADKEDEKHQDYDRQYLNASGGVGIV